MCEVNIENFNEKFDEIEKTLKNAKLIGIDCEFSALYPLKNSQPSLFDNSSERYTKLRKNLECTIPLQVGLTAFSFDPDKNTYTGKIYNFYLLPPAFAGIDTCFYVQSSTLQFLRSHGFDFNKFAFLGIPYLNKIQEKELRCKFNNNEIYMQHGNLVMELRETVDEQEKLVKDWYNDAKMNDRIVLSKINCNDIEFTYYFHQQLRAQYVNIWTVVKNNQFVVIKLPKSEVIRLDKMYNLNEEVLQNLLGFTRVFRLLVSLKKPIVGHNTLQDLVLMINHFDGPLPEKYSNFKKLANDLFPVIFDTKMISYEVKKRIPAEKQWTENILNVLFNYFKNGIGEHLVQNSPRIEIESEVDNYGHFHEAGWDSFCTGYIFIKLAHIQICSDYPKTKVFMSTELIAGVAHFKNCINVIRGHTSYIRLDGPDPVSMRPPWQVIERTNNKPVDINQVSSLLSSFGYIEIKKLAHQNNRALLAVDNVGNARRMRKILKDNQEYQIKSYNVFKHSPIVRVFLYGGITISGFVLIWLTHRTIFKAVLEL